MTTPSGIDPFIHIRIAMHRENGTGLYLKPDGLLMI
jgi:hypothetical protein